MKRGGGANAPFPLAGVLDVLDADVIRVGTEVGGMLVMGLSAFFAVKAEVKAMSRAIVKIEEQVSKIANIITDQRLMDQRLAHAEEDIRDLQRGEGHVMPFTRSPYEHGKD